jgi:glucose-1-phosphate adenylyltransferase
MLTQPDGPFQFYDPTRPIYTRARFLPPAHVDACSIARSTVAEGVHMSKATIEESVIGIRSTVREGSRIVKSVINGADFYEAPNHSGPSTIPLGIGRNCVLERVIVDKNARIGDGCHLTNEAGVQTADGPGYVIREGIIIVRNGGAVPPGTRV